jgi:hypothetical protein
VKDRHLATVRPKWVQLMDEWRGVAQRKAA